MMIRWLSILVVANYLGKVFPNCQYEIFKKCHHAIGQSYRGDQASGVTDTIAKNCKAFQAIIDCLDEHTLCSGDFLHEFRFTIYSSAVMFQRVSCPGMKYYRLKILVQGVKNKMGVADLESLPVNDCAIASFRGCVLVKFARDMVTNPDICQNIDKTVSCFEKKSRTCHSALLQAFINVLERHSKHLTHIAEENKADVNLCSS